jgi:hypothetical protein
MCREASNCSNLHLSKRFSSPFRRLSVFDQALDFLSKIKFGKTAATVRTTWIPVRPRFSLRQVRNSNSTVRTLAYHGPDARMTDMEIACSRSPVQTCDRLDDSASPPGRGSQTGKIFSGIFEISVAQLSVRTAPSFIKPDTHLSLQPINRGLCA